MSETKNIKELSVEEKLRALYDLQLIDSRLDEIRNTRGELPLEVDDLSDDVAQLETRIQKVVDETKGLDEDIKLKKEAIKNAETLIKKYTKQQDNVRNNREFDALAKEIEYQGLEIELSEKRIREFTIKIQQKNSQIEDFNTKLVSMKEHLSHKQAQLDTIVKDTEKEEAVLLKLSAEYADKIEKRLFDAYSRIRSSVKNGLAVVPVERGASAGSFFTIPPQRQMDIAQRKKIITDEHSGRILVDLELALEEQEKMEYVIKG
ncbi:zinc ribbon domain-containing protein [Chishuiella sp.]|uniref:zinc ribbon domain-containing protein n=1 Tax=Chishuiella sp. TaxID=1969467 RepID=UPI0028AFE184|nr:C4-type zinc ribbon domain-containing protein [Chishuiella sp.]